MVKCCGPSKYNARDLRTVIAFQRKVRTDDGAGGKIVTWEAFSGAPTRAKAMYASGSERYASERVEARVSVKIAVRYFAGLLEADRVVIDNKPYNIRFINNVDFRDEWLEIGLDGGVAT